MVYRMENIISLLKISKNLIEAIDNRLHTISFVENY